MRAFSHEASMLTRKPCTSTTFLPHAITCKSIRAPRVNLTTSAVSDPVLGRWSSKLRCSGLSCSRRVVLASASPPVAAPTEQAVPRLAVFVSGGGSNFKAIHAAILDGRINAEVVAVISDVPGCGGEQYAASHGIATLTYPIPKKGGMPGLTEAELVLALKEQYKADYVILAGFLKLIPSNLVSAYKRAMLNIHPGLLPGFGGKGMYGTNVHKAVIKSGSRVSGPTVHFVDEEFDTGPILAQRVVPVYPTDSYSQLQARVLKEEHLVYPEAVAALVDGRITWREDGVPILWTAH